jgi:PAS domain S-box-containing protein
MGGRQKQSAENLGAMLYGHVFDHLLEGCQIISRDYRYLYVNEVVVAQGRSTRGKLLGKTMEECYPGIEKTEMFGHLRRVIEEGTPHNMDNEFRFPDGMVGWFELRMEPLPEGAIILSIDITERKRAEERARLLEELKRTFVRVVSDQLRLPLSMVQDNLENLRSVTAGNFGTEERLKVVQANNAAVEVIERLSEMVSAVDASHDDQKVTKQPIRFEDIWQPIYAECKRKSAAERVRLVYAAPTLPLPIVRCDPHKIKLVLLGLTDNALRYTTSGKVTVTLDHKAGTIHFQISDTGSGLPAEEQPRVFHRFFRGRNAAKMNPEGTGLSLAVAKYHIEGHGGRIGFTSEAGKGSTFWFEVPVE